MTNRGDITTNEQLDDAKGTGMYSVKNIFWGTLLVFYNRGYCQQIRFTVSGSTIETRIYNSENQTWTNWMSYAFNIPSFYKNYNSLAELKAVLEAI